MKFSSCIRDCVKITIFDSAKSGGEVGSWLGFASVFFPQKLYASVVQGNGCEFPEEQRSGSQDLRVSNPLP